MDAEFYSALRGLEFTSELEATRDIVAVGLPGRLSPHPFLDYGSQPPELRRAWRNARVHTLVERLAGPEADRSAWGPLASGTNADRDRMLGLARSIGSNVALLPLRRPHTSIRAQCTTIIVVARDRVSEAERSVRLLRAHSGAAELDVIVIDDGSAPHAALGLGARLDHAALRLIRIPRGGLADVDAVWDVARDFALGERLVVLGAGSVVRQGWLAPLMQLLEDPSVTVAQPLLVDTDDLISARLGIALAGRPPDDPRIHEHLRADCPDPTAAAVRTADLRRSPGMMSDPSRLAGAVRVAPASLVTEAMSVAPVRPATTGRAVVARHSSGPRAPRWGLRLPSTPGHWGDVWGDTHFAGGIAAGLRELGHDVVTYRSGSLESAPFHEDDVHLHLRGRVRTAPAPGRLNVLWVISHPDTVDAEELGAFDLVLAGSTSWAAEATRRTGRTVIPLLQATAIVPDSIAEPVPSRCTEALFVGNAEGRRRPIIDAALDAGIPLAVYGRGWEGRLPRGAWRAQYVEPALLPAMYRRHGVVLADHWADMAAHGFIANRVFDIVAAGAVAVVDQPCDQLPELDRHVWPMSVLRGADLNVLAATRPTPEQATEVARRHGFSARAQTLVNAVRSSGLPLLAR